MRCRGQVTPDVAGARLRGLRRRGHRRADPDPLSPISSCTVDGAEGLPRRRVRPAAGARLAARPGGACGPRRLPRTAHAPYRSSSWRPRRTAVDAESVAERRGFAFDYASLLACAWGKPFGAFGPMYAPLRRRAPRPAPARAALPLHVAHHRASTAPWAQVEAGATVEAEYDVPADAWYFERERRAHHAVLRARWRPRCSPAAGWPPTSAARCRPTSTSFPQPRRHGHGAARESARDAGRCSPAPSSPTCSEPAGMIIESFAVECHARRRAACWRSTAVSGSSSPTAFEQQAGLPPVAAERARLTEPCDMPRRSPPATRALLRGTPPAPRSLLHDRPRHRLRGPRAGRAGLGGSAPRRTSTPASGSSRRTSSRTPCSPARSASRRCASCSSGHLIERGLDDGLARARASSRSRPASR